MENWKEQRGPWSGEPDEHRFEHAGLSCVLKRGPGGHWCGYVSVDESHPLYGFDYGQESPHLKSTLAGRLELPLGETPSFGLMISALSGEVRPTPESVFVVHGGITYAENCAPEDEDKSRWWFGFDCAHSGDLSPKWHNSSSQYRASDVYRDIEFVTAEAKKLAKQLAALATSAAPVTNN